MTFDVAVVQTPLKVGIVKTGTAEQACLLRVCHKPHGAGMPTSGGTEIVAAHKKTPHAVRRREFKLFSSEFYGHEVVY